MSQPKLCRKKLHSMCPANTLKHGGCRACWNARRRRYRGRIVSRTKICPEREVVRKADIPHGAPARRVEDGYWASVMEQIKLLVRGEALRVRFPERDLAYFVSAHVSCYTAARRAGIRVSVTWAGDSLYLLPIRAERKVAA